VTVAATIEHLGGWATRSELRKVHSRRTIERAVAEGSVVKVGRVRFTAPTTAKALQHAARLDGHLSHLSAALHHGWKVKTVPTQTWVTIPRKRGALACDTDEVHVHRSDVALDESRDRVTTPLRTVLDCARTLPFDEALTVADSALRSGKVGREELRAAAAKAAGPGSVQVRRVARHASAKAANPLESVLRALTIEVGLDLTPQLQVTESGMFAVVDLGNEDLLLIVEAEGYETHGTRKGLRRDCVRHTEFAVFGWTSLRYAYEDVMFEQEWVRWSLLALLAHRAGTKKPACPRRARAA
jgi:very-short-patch-repair endonuclease